MPDADPLRLQFAQFELDEADARLLRAGQPVALAPKAFAVLCALLRRRGQLMTKSALIDAVWGHQFISESVLKTTISELRAALNDDAKQPRFIETASRRGYRFIAPTQRVGQRSAAEPPTPTPAAEVVADGVGASQIIGRQDAIARLRQAWAMAGAASRRIVWVVGEAGIGKTTLIDGFIAGLGPALVARGQCIEQYGAGEPYLPVFEALAGMCRADATLVPMLRAIAPTWLLQLPWLTGEAERDSLRRELAGSSPDRMLREFGELLERYTERVPVLLVTEDLHWSDHATIQLINHLARRRTAAQLMWLASFRPAEVIDADHPLRSLRHELRLHRLCDEIVLEPFSEQEVARYLEQRHPGAKASDALISALHGRTEGLPLFVSNVLDDLVTQGVLGADDAPRLTEARIAALEVPESLAGVIEKQIARLTPDQCELMEVASVCGAEFRSATVARATDRAPNWVGEHCDAFVRRRQWLREAKREHESHYAFRHALYRQVFYQRIGALRRAELHRSVAVALEQELASGAAVSAAELASHCELGRDLMKALSYAAQAAEKALRHFSPREAIELSAHALKLVPQCPPSEQRDALELALAALQGGSSAHVYGVSADEPRDAFERAVALLDVQPQHPLRAFVLYGLASALLSRGDIDRARSLGERIFALSNDGDDPMSLISAAILLGQLDALQGQAQKSLRLLERGIAAAEHADQLLSTGFAVVDPIVLLHAMIAFAKIHVGLADQAQQHCDFARRRAQRLRQPLTALVATWLSALIQVRLRDPDRVNELASEMEQVAQAEALDHGLSPSRWNRGLALALLGRPAEGYEMIRAAHEESLQRRYVSGGAEVFGYSAEALLLMRDWSGADARLDLAFDHATRFGERGYLAQLLILRAKVALGRGDFSSARAFMQKALEEARLQESVWLELTVWIEFCELQPTRAGDLESLARARARLTEGFNTPLVRRADALLGRVASG